MAWQARTYLLSVPDDSKPVVTVLVATSRESHARSVLAEALYDLAWESCGDAPGNAYEAAADSILNGASAVEIYGERFELRPGVQ